MFEPFKNKKDEKEIIRAIVFEPRKHEIRFYEYMIGKIRITINEKGFLESYEFFDGDQWQGIKEGDILVNDTVYYGDPHRFHIETDYINENYERMEEGRLPFIDSVKGVIIQDDEGSILAVKSRSTGHVVYETFFIEQYHNLVDEINEKGLDYDSFYDELEKRTFTHIEELPFIDLTTC